ncbi:glycosyltransferase [Variovorax ginsengisoli]|uniref:Glycosyltransferase n=2 Tax=Variovorax guangxiensis TaxID=1775474 RepID=A0A502DGK8_9BURK|nr:glycosyltransferase [Variovorax guangxiensis]RZL59633.1 MAG: glycosyltransferase [Variovorax sp.]TPG17502.1 glycosyltransferase [Variovorax ginsengisoli]TPG23589.1 glycosyltransferase [Variovorax guangxiensis]
MIGIVIPAHNEAALIGACLVHARACAHDPQLRGESVEIVVVADDCNDATVTTALNVGVIVLHIQARNVGLARAAGAELMLSRGARWLAFTDADTLVSSDWLSQQLSLDSDAVCGTVEVTDWTPHGNDAPFLARHFAISYQDADDHRHVHGANMGVSADAYRRAGGFQALASSEDVALVAALERSGASISWSARPRVCTSARKIARAPAGFAEALRHAVACRSSPVVIDASAEVEVPSAARNPLLMRSAKFVPVAS